MLNRIVKTATLWLLVLVVFGCDIEKSERRDSLVKNSQSPQSTETQRMITQDESVESLCKRLHEIKKLPYRDPNDTDPIYEALIAKGKEAMPCLIEKITDETSMPDPREAPPWRQYKVGDTAVFILARIAGDNEKILPKMLPPAYEKEWETNGVYAYFNYVSESKNRKELQKWWRKWVKQNLNNDQK